MLIDTDKMVINVEVNNNNYPQINNQTKYPKIYNSVDNKYNTQNKYQQDINKKTKD